MKRIITEDEEKCYRLRHPDFMGFTTKETAKKMKVSIEKVRRLLKSLKQKCPNLFPILTYRQQLVYWLYMDKGLPQHRIAKYLGTTQSNISSILKRVQIPEPHGLGNIMAYENEMDDKIFHKF